MNKDDTTTIENSQPLAPKSIEEELEEKEIEEEPEKEQDGKVSTWVSALLIFLVALSVGLIYLYMFAKPENANPYWYGDVYHRWQVAFLSKEVGFHHGFLRLWDLKGMEYFWGLLYPLVTIFLFVVTGSTSIVLVRLLSIFSGAAVAALLFVIVKRYFNLWAAYATAIFVIVFPLAIFTNTTGEQEPFGLMLLLIGVILWPRRAFWTGVFWALASMVRAEYWVFTAALVAIELIRDRSLNRGIALLAGWGGPILLYMKYLLDNTGNPIYPVYWNFLGNAAGQWFKKVDLNQTQILAQWIGRGIAGFGVVGGLITVLKKPRYWALFLLGFGNVAFVGLMFGFTAYIYGFIPRFWVDRLLYWPYLFSGLLVILFLFYLPRNLKYVKIVSVFVFIVFIAATQLLWPTIRFWEAKAEATFPEEVQIADNIASVYKGDGAVLIFEDRPVVIYALVNYHQVKGKNIVSQMYDPFFYAKEDPFKNWSQFRLKFIDFIKKENIRYIAVYPKKENYHKMIQREKGMFHPLKIDNNIEVYSVSL